MKACILTCGYRHIADMLPSYDLEYDKTLITLSGTLKP